MPLFRCDQCGCIENTALGEWWGRSDKKRLCSECSTGTWHGRFKKRSPEEAGYVDLGNGFYGPSGGWK